MHDVNLSYTASGHAICWRRYIREGKKAERRTRILRCGFPRTRRTLPRVVFMYLRVVASWVVPQLLASKWMPNEVMHSWDSVMRGAVLEPSGSVSRMPGSGPSGSCPHSWTRERNLSWAIVSLNTIAKSEAMSALRCLI